MNNTETPTTKTIQPQLIRSGRETPSWSVSILVNGRCVETVHFPSKREARAAMPDLANKYR